MIPRRARLLPLVKWVRWRLLSEPFREAEMSQAGLPDGDDRPCHLTPSSAASLDPFGALAYAGGTFPSCRSLRRRAPEPDGLGRNASGVSGSPGPRSY